jgi:hypothetical protein
MFEFFLSAVVGVAVICALFLAVLRLLERSWKSGPRPLVAEFNARRDEPRAITRIRKEHLDWEIN